MNEDTVMRTILLAGAVAIISSTQASFAADVAAPYVEPDIAAVYDWSGVYVGLQAGYSWAEAGYYLDIPPDTDSGETFDIDGGVAGAHAGYNWQWNSVVLGVEGDVEWAGLEGDDDGEGGTIDMIEANYQASIRARLGFAMDNILIYGTAGWAWLNVDYSRPDFDSEVLSETLDGPTAGLGVEVGFTPNWTGRAEYRWAGFDEEAFPFSGGSERTLRDMDTHTVRFGISYGF